MDNFHHKHDLTRNRKVQNLLNPVDLVNSSIQCDKFKSESMIHYTCNLTKGHDHKKTKKKGSIPHHQEPIKYNTHFEDGLNEYAIYMHTFKHAYIYIDREIERESPLSPFFFFFLL
jgi:hypothetical protein